MPVVLKMYKGRLYWRVRISKKPERHLYFPESEDKEVVRQYGLLASRYIRGLAQLDEVREYPDLYVKMKQVKLIPEDGLLSIAEAADYLHVSYSCVAVLSLGSMYPLKFEVINGRRYFHRDDLVRWARDYKEKGSRNPWAWNDIPELSDERIQS